MRRAGPSGRRAPNEGKTSLQIDEVDPAEAVAPARVREIHRELPAKLEAERGVRFWCSAGPDAARYVPAVRIVLVLIAGALLGVVTWLVVGTPFTKRPVTKAQIERTVAHRTPGHVQLTLCNEEVVPSRTPRPDPPQTWTCDTYVGPSAADAQNGPSYEVTVSHDRIESIRRVATH